MISTLLLDSEFQICTEISQVLGRCRPYARTAETLEKALQLARQSPFDAILVEINLRLGSKDSASAGRDSS